MGPLTQCFVPRGGVLYTMIVPWGGFLVPSSRVQGGIVFDEIDTCIIFKRSLFEIKNCKKPPSEFDIINRIKKTKQIEVQIAKSPTNYFHTLKNGMELKIY